MGVLDPGGDAAPVEEAARDGRIAGREAERKRLDRHLDIDPGVDRVVDCARAALPELGEKRDTARSRTPVTLRNRPGDASRSAASESRGGRLPRLAPALGPCTGAGPA
jgi:hypothetical protein